MFRFLFFLVLIWCSINVNAQNPTFYEIHKIQNEYVETQSVSLYLKHWDTLFYNQQVSPLDKVNFIRGNAFEMPSDTLIQRAKYLALSCGYVPEYSVYAQLGGDYRRIYMLDSVNHTSNLYQIDSLVQVWNSNLTEEKRVLNARIAKLWADEYYYYQGHYKHVAEHSHLGEDYRDSILEKCWATYIQICELQGCVPNSFDNNWDDQASYMIVFKHLTSIIGKDSTITIFLNLWEQNMKYFIAAFKQGKISNEFCYFYDLNLEYSSGVQYFGTLKDVPMKDVEGFEQRREEFEIDNLILQLKDQGRY
ncbi:MAG: hypothetical protein LBU91_02640 [Bacteroidales bacterium]|jgi:hypothetical protein|nr:hypothetical protein [Bacteroidales bacterium]